HQSGAGGTHGRELPIGTDLAADAGVSIRTGRVAAGRLHRRMAPAPRTRRHAPLALGGYRETRAGRSGAGPSPPLRRTPGPMPTLLHRNRDGPDERVPGNLDLAAVPVRRRDVDGEVLLRLGCRGHLHRHARHVARLVVVGAPLAVLAVDDEIHAPVLLRKRPHAVAAGGERRAAQVEPGIGDERGRLVGTGAPYLIVRHHRTEDRAIALARAAVQDHDELSA